MVYKESSQLVTCGIFTQAENLSFTVSFAYGFNLPTQRLHLWEELDILNSRHPWSVIGDFNQILRTSQHSNHLTEEVGTIGMEDFNLVLQDANLFEAPSKGLTSSWWNKSESNPTSKRIDRALINEVWAQRFRMHF